MKTLLIYPYFLDPRLDEKDVEVVPQGLYYVAAVLQAAGVETVVADLHGFRGRSEAIRERIAAIQPDVIGISVLHANRWGAVDIARIAKAVRPETPVVFGGVGATFLWDHFLLRFPEIDYVVLGEGEYSFLELVRALDAGDAGAVRGIRGLAFRDAGHPVRTGPREPIPDLDALPHPARTFTYSHILLSRGCPGRCTFCASPRFWPGPLRSHSADYFLDELEMLSDRGVGHFFISDDTFTLDPAKVMAICRGIIERNLSITWQAISRVDHVSAKLLFWMRKAGCIQISYGVESGSAAVRRRLGKPLQPEKIRRAFALTTRFGILSRAYFIYGSPGETWDTIQATVDLMLQIKPLAAIFYVLTLFPGTALADGFLRKTGKSDDVWLERREDIPYCETDPGLSCDLVVTFGRTLRKRFYEMLPDAVAAIHLDSKASLRPLHADFLSRLGMTFHQGDYSRVDAIPDKASIAYRLYRRALDLYPDSRALLGLAMLQQQAGETGSAEKTLRDGIREFPEDIPLALCLGIHFMNQGRWDEALAVLGRFAENPEIRPYLDECRRRSPRSP
ncbi:MAG: cobalamin-dependent protein [Deltaproteobacteria bacterium]|nr:cobalamin-dependent protein [Deltaproteobacteria bacterium]